MDLKQLRTTGRYTLLGIAGSLVAWSGVCSCGAEASPVLAVTQPLSSMVGSWPADGNIQDGNPANPQLAGSDPTVARGQSGPAQSSCPTAKILADTTVQREHPTTNYGRSFKLGADDPPYENRTLIRFLVTGANGRHITKATLRLFAALNTPAGGRVRVSSCNWSESTVTWSTRPTFSTVLDTAGQVAAGQRVGFDITPLFAAQGDGIYCVGIDNILADENYSSREARAGRPDVVLETDCPCEAVNGGGKSHTTQSLRPRGAP